MAKIELDKYYTPKDLAEYCVNKTKEIIGEENITEWLEPSAGCGNFLDYLGDNYLAYDIAPEDDRIIKQDYLELDLEYKKGRCIIGNPPYGEYNLLSEKFFKKSIQLGNYISFIQPISQLNNNIKMYEFDLIYSEDLGELMFSGIKKVRCCLNIYVKPKNGLNKKKSYKLKDVTATRLDRNSGKDINDYDIAFCSYGASIGKIIHKKGMYSQEIYIKVNNIEFKERVVSLLSQCNWRDIIPMTATPKIQIWRVYKYIKEQIPEIE